METAIYYLLVAAGFGAMFWQQTRRRRPLGALRPALDEGADIALHLAGHEARSRGEPLSPLHILYALVQDAATAEAIARSGGDVGAVEDRVFAALEAPPAELEPPDEVGEALGLAIAIGRAEDRPGRCADLWAGLTRATPRTAALVEAGGVSAVDVLFTLIHGVAEPQLAEPSGQLIALTLRNDPVSTMEGVVEILRRVFELDEDEARERMLETHHEGRSDLGQRPRSEALALVQRAHRIARSRGFPLWIELEEASA